MSVNGGRDLANLLLHLSDIISVKCSSVVKRVVRTWRRRDMYLPTVSWLTWTLSLIISLWMRGVA